jgi:hypothetical protein
MIINNDKITGVIVNGETIDTSNIKYNTLSYISKGNNKYDTKINDGQTLGFLEGLSKVNKVPYFNIRSKFISIRFPFGSGKSYIVLGIISANVKNNINNKNNSNKVRFNDEIPFDLTIPTNINWEKTFNEVKFQGTITRSFGKSIDTNIIFVGKSVVEQWITYLKDTTYLKYLVIDNIIKLRIFVDIFNDNPKNLENYDVIIVKNDRVTVPLGNWGKIKVELNNLVNNAYIINIIGNVLRGYIINRVFLDDLDTIELPDNVSTINAKFTYVVSATQNGYENNRNERMSFDILDYLRNYNNNYKNITKNNLLFHTNSVQCTDTLINNSINIGKPKYIEYVIKNNDVNYINALNTLGEMGDISATEIMNDILADAPATAAQKAGIMTNSVAEIFEKVLGDKYQRYKFSKEIITFIDELFKYCSTLASHSNEYMSKRVVTELFNTYKSKNKHNHCHKHNHDHNHDHNHEHNHEPKKWSNVTEFFKIYCNGNYNYSNLGKVCMDIYNEEVKIQEDIGKAIERVKDNLKSQQCCPICYDDLSGTNNITIFKCCGIIPCQNCGFKNSNLKKIENKIQMQCPSCRKMVGLLDVIGIDKDFDINKIINDEEIGDINKIEEISNEVEINIDVEKNINYSEWSKAELALSFALQTNKLYIVEDEIVKDEIVEDEIVEDEIVEDEIVKDEIVKDEIVEDEIVEDEIVEDEIVKTDKFEDMMLNEESNTNNIKKYVEYLKNKFNNVHTKVLKKNVDKYRILPNGIISKLDIGGVISNDKISEMKSVENGNRKIVYYAKHDETLKNLETIFNEYGIPFLRINGTASMIHHQVMAFNNDLVNILIINGEKYSSGLNLQKADTLIMCHPITNHAHRSQIIGRLMRIGATTKKNIVTIKYDVQNE